MGTRHWQCVIDKEGERKIQQYGQWDGYPDGQGKDILAYLRKANLAKYQQELGFIKLITDEQGKVVDGDKDWSKTYPYLSRDCGANIHQMIEDGEVRFVNYTSEEEASKWCEGFYIIDFSKNEFESEFHDRRAIFPLDDLPSEEEYLKAMEDKESF